MLVSYTSGTKGSRINTRQIVSDHPEIKELEAFTQGAKRVCGRPRYAESRPLDVWSGISSAGRGGHVKILGEEISIINWPYDHEQDPATTNDLKNSNVSHIRRQNFAENFDLHRYL